jgi:hypothetical protein
VRVATLNPTNLGFMTMPDHSFGHTSDADDAVTAFERARQELYRSKRTKTAIFSILFLLALASSLWVSEVSVGKIVDGWPGLVAYIQGTLPVIRAEHIVAALTER